MHETCAIQITVGRPTDGERRFVANQHKLFALNIIEIVDFLFLKHFFCAKKQRQNSLLLAVFLVVENGHFKFCYRKRSKISPKSDFLVAAWGEEI